MTTTTRAARTQVERSAAMQLRLLDAAVESLCELGYAATTTLEVQRRAAVSRGALLHHYASRSELMLAAVDHLSRQRINDVLTLAQTSAPRTKKLDWAVRVMWSTFQGPLYAASLELWLAARRDEELLAALLPQERILGQAIRGMARELFAPWSEEEGYAEAIELLFDAMRGAAARAALRGPDNDGRLINSWTAMIRLYLPNDAA